MTESNLIQVDNDTLKKEFELFKNISPKSQNESVRNEYLAEMEKIFNESDKKHDGKIDRKEFETLIKGYFEMKNIQRTEENFDQYFDKLDIDHSHHITFQEFVSFMDQVNENDIIPFLSEEMQNRGLF